MSRYSRRSEPALRPKQRVELTTGKIAMRLMIVGIAGGFFWDLLKVALGLNW